MSIGTLVNSVIDVSGMIANVGIEVEIQLLVHSVQFLFPRPVPVTVISNFGQCRQCHIQVGHGRKSTGSSWNRVANSYRSSVIFYFWLDDRAILNSDDEPTS